MLINYYFMTQIIKRSNKIVIEYIDNEKIGKEKWCWAIA